MSNSPKTKASKAGNTIHKLLPDGKFTIVSNSVAQNERLSIAARGLLLYLLSLPASWEIRMDVTQRNAGIGRDALRRLIRELADAGHMHRFVIPKRDASSGYSGSRWHVFASPADLAAKLAQTGSPKGFHRRPPENPSVWKSGDVHKETVQTTKDTQRPKPTPAELAAFLAANGLSQRVAAVYFATDDAYQAFSSNADGSTPSPRDWRAGLLSFANSSASAASTVSA